MLLRTLYSNGKNNFKDDQFSACEWSAPTMVAPEEIKSRLDSFHLCGRVIKHIRFVGHSFYHTRDWIEEAAYNQLNGYSEEERQLLSSYGNIDSNMLFARAAQIDEPLVLEFEDNDRFEIDTPQAPEFRMSMNCLPRWIESSYGIPNIEAENLFAPCIGQMISSVNVKTYLTKVDPMFSNEFTEPPYEREVVSAIEIEMKDKSRLLISPYIDFCSVSYVDKDGVSLKLPFIELKEALVNWEDLHDDDSIGFHPESASLFVGKKGAEYAEQPYMSVGTSGENGHTLFIGVDDFTVLGWCISHFNGECFDEYGDYTINKGDWNNILKEAKALLDFDTFDELFDTTVAWNIRYRNGKNYMLCELNSSGVIYWENREQYKKQINDLTIWTALVLKEAEEIQIYGF